MGGARSNLRSPPIPDPPPYARAQAVFAALHKAKMLACLDQGEAAFTLTRSLYIQIGGEGIRNLNDGTPAGGILIHLDSILDMLCKASLAATHLDLVSLCYVRF